MQISMTSGYSKQQYNAQLGDVTPRILIGDGLEERVKFDSKTNRPVEPRKVESQRTWMYFPGLGIQAVKLPANYSLPNDIEDMAEVELESPEACIVNRQLYVRAKGIKPM